jgi:hypothetical protein
MVMATDHVAHQIGAVVIPVGMLPGDAAVVVDKWLHRLRQVHDLGDPLDEDPLAEERLRKDTEHHAGVAGEVARLHRGLAGADDHVARFVQADRHR